MSKLNVVASLPRVGEPFPICPCPMTSPLPPPPPVAAQLTEKVVLVVPPDGTVTVRGFAPLTLQFDARPDSASVWSPAGRAEVALALVPIGWLVEPPTVVL